MFLFIFENWIYLTNCLVHQKNWKLLLIFDKIEKTSEHTQAHTYRNSNSVIFQYV